ncbi:Gfo/Idh/MocA family oxidoreductase [Wenzhouxiangella sp. XN24]|uniref:Gfo/Idh/MocA family protein n=1 Tax=Wenzhouxiangella sp. XN24 TaxID=2713569 RepID=UPI0013EBA50E|nr:Gfo/Idh/MocA family oxidoreductase [Wenzhouxiangella sp. XN24]NGX17023.1 Gfo/Idh/MocA family oxidoreductase [Wenzhouxiangella sp. XN24]
MATESYLDQPLSYKLRKVARYANLYGIGRTIEKVRAQYHMGAQLGFDGVRYENRECNSPDDPNRTIGLMGCGSFAYSTIAFYLNKFDPGCIRAAMDTDSARARSLVDRYGAAYATTDPAVIVNDPRIDLVFVASNHASHAPYAVMALDAGKDVHIEKPHVVTSQQLSELVSAIQRNPDRKVYLGFNRPRSNHFVRLQRVLLEEEGPAMINWFIAGHEIAEGHWYFDEAEGGRILGNLCHWSDLTLQIVGLEKAFPCRIVPCSPVGAKSDFVTSIEFADGSMAALTFSAKGHTFEGVREVLNLHKGQVLAEIKDFKSLSLMRGATRWTHSSWWRDHGHRANILNSHKGSRYGEPKSAADLAYLVATAELFLKIREAHDQRREIIVERPL